MIWRSGTVILSMLLSLYQSMAGASSCFDPNRDGADSDGLVRMMSNPPYAEILSESRQGGDTLEEAVSITLPFSGSGSTIGYSDDYDAECIWYSIAPDVVYSFLPTENTAIVVDLWGSEYDTKVFIFNANLETIACNDDFYDNYVSRLEMVNLVAGTQYFIIVDGHDPPGGNYEIQVYENQLNIPPDAVPEGEPTLYTGYVDEYNSGCNYSLDQPLLQDLFGNALGNLDLHGHLGWLDYDPYSIDTDWYSILIGDTGIVSVEFTPQIESRLTQLDPPDCNGNIGQSMDALMDSPVTMTLTGDPGSVAWFVIHPLGYPPSGYTEAEYSYLLSFSGIVSSPVSTERASWSAVKSLYK